MLPSETSAASLRRLGVAWAWGTRGPARRCRRRAVRLRHKVPTWAVLCASMTTWTRRTLHLPTWWPSMWKAGMGSCYTASSARSAPSEWVCCRQSSTVLVGLVRPPVGYRFVKPSIGCGVLATAASWRRKAAAFIPCPTGASTKDAAATSFAGRGHTCVSYSRWRKGAANAPSSRCHRLLRVRVQRSLGQRRTSPGMLLRVVGCSRYTTSAS
mmetsp:Transcript_66433/g.160384  ORF Transcript_66433/g.160384 Transcript_66433/m.160384 type:complete len:212 (-) Transcript_66433:695-1330(-)